MITRANRLGMVSGARASRLWTNVDHLIARQAPVIPLYSYGVASWVSPTVRNYLYSPFAGVLLDQLWRASPHG
jgi:ABC-type transport system substrate-binding protein